MQRANSAASASLHGAIKTSQFQAHMVKDKHCKCKTN